MTILRRSLAGAPRVPLAVLLLVATLVTGGRLLGLGPMGGPDPADAIADDAETLVAADPPIASAAADLDRIRANVDFWGERSSHDARDFVSATRYAIASMDLARATGDPARYVVAETALTAALATHPGYGPARSARGAVLVALHRFPEARDLARAVLVDLPDDATALATLGDASLELGDLTTARQAYEQLGLVAPSAAASVRTGRLAYIEGRPAAAVTAAREAVTAALDDEADPSTVAWYHAQLGEVLLSTGDRVGAVAAYEAALAIDRTASTALAGRARIAAADGRLDEAIADLDAAIAVIPLPELLARRADLLERRDAGDDAQRATIDRGTILAIADLSEDAGRLYDRTMSLYLATTGIDPARALRLAEAEIAVRQDVFGYDALGWALLANDRATEADEALTMALTVGTRDARLLYHAGAAAAAVGDAARARALLEDALTLDPTFDLVSADRARAILADLP